MKSAFLTIASLFLISIATPKAFADTPPPLAPGYAPLAFPAPDPASYALPKLFAAADGDLLDENGQSLRLHSLFGDKVVVLSFIYATCSEVNGCPLATSVLHRIKQRLAKAPQLADELRLITLSFSPDHDTPEVMSAYGKNFAGSGVEWRFLTTRSDGEIRPILERYNQTVQKEYDEEGRFTGNFSHALRVYLIDRAHNVRNIYSTSFLHPDTLVGDIKNLIDHDVVTGTDIANRSDRTLRPGDDKRGYSEKSYRTDSVALTERRGAQTRLIRFAEEPPLGLPPLPIPADNPLTEQKIALGRRLFFDRRLSLNNTVSCAMCHIPEQGFTNNELATAVGIEGRSVRRNTPTLFNAGYATRLFHDGRETTLEQQVWGPLLASNEMANPSIGFVIETIRALPEYESLFEHAFSRGATMETIGMALASYQRTLNAADSSFDRWRFKGEEGELTEAAKRGFELFRGKAGCTACHSMDENHALFTDNRMHNTGIGYRESMEKTPEKRKITLAPGLSIEVESAALSGVQSPRPNDLGYYEITQDPKDRWKYKTPSLRNVALTAPYMHNGSLTTLREVVEFYNAGGVPNETLDPLIRPLGLNQREMDVLVAFLESLTGSNVPELVEDAFAAPVGDPK